MLWFIVIWLASGLIVPLLLLLRTAHRWLAPALARSVARLRGLDRTYARSALVLGSVGIAVLVFLLSGLFSASPGTTGDQASASALAAQEQESPDQTVARSQSAADDGLLSEPASPSVAALVPGPASTSDSSHPTEVVDTDLPAAVSGLPGASPNLKASPEDRSPRYRRTPRPSPLPYTTVRSNRGTWVFPPNENGNG